MSVHVCEGELSERAVWGEREQNLISTKLIIPEIKSALSENGALPLAGRTQGQQFTRPPSAFLSLVEIWALGVRAAGRIPRLSASLWAGSGHVRGVIDP